MIKKISQKTPHLDIPKHFTEHIGELRQRLFVVIASMSVGAIISYLYREQILFYLLKPLASQQLYYDTPLGAMSFTFEICLIAGMLLSSPIWLYQLWSFLRPAVPSIWQQRFGLWVSISTLLALGGSAYGYFVSLPATLSISQYFQTEQLTPLLSAPEYLSFVTRYILSFAIFFQIPMIVFFCRLAGFISSKDLLKYQRHSFVASCVIGAVFTPTPDFINQLALAVPLFVLYEISVAAVVFSERFHKK